MSVTVEVPDRRSRTMSVQITESALEMEREFSRRLEHEILFGPDVPYAPRAESIRDGLTPEQFYRQELAWW